MRRCSREVEAAHLAAPTAIVMPSRQTRSRWIGRTGLLPGKQRSAFPAAWVACGDHLQVTNPTRGVGGLHQKARPHRCTPKVAALSQSCAARRQRDLPTHVGLGLNRRAPPRECRLHQTSRMPGHGFGRSAIDGSVEGNDAAEARWDRLQRLRRRTADPRRSPRRRVGSLTITQAVCRSP